MLTIAGLRLPSPLILAPLAGYSDLPFRRLCREFGAAICVSEMISCHGLAYRQKKTLQMLASDPAEKPVSFQLFGADVYMMAKAAGILNAFSPDLIDLNMGCPVKKVTKKGAGAALMATPELAEKIIREVVKNSRAPVTVKFRKGVDASSVSCVDFAKMVEGCGAAAVIVHGRTWSQGFTGTADWQCVADVKKAVSLPVIGNGDIGSYEEARQRLLNSGCDGVMIGRGALGNPWVFSDKGRPAESAGIFKGVIRHLELMEQHLEVDHMLAIVKNHIGRYFKNMQGSALIRKQIYASKSFAELRTLIQSLEGKC
jgi:nifR3 family TIM-barrel protein